MWRPVALSAFLALLFMSSRSGQAPVETNTNDLAKTDFGAASTQDSGEPIPVRIDLASSSAHPKGATGETMPSAQVSANRGDDVNADAPVQMAGVEAAAGVVIPLPEPKADPSQSATRVVVTQGEQRTALTTDDDALRLMPQGPDFAARVQQELARLGCYRGKVDNIWGPMSRNAVARLNRVANANLPLKQPTRALLSSARKAPDGYCNGGGQSGSRVASLEPSVGLQDLQNRPSYLPPWMRGEPMPAPEEQAAQEPESQAAATPDSAGEAAAPETSSTTARRAARPEPSRVQRVQVRRNVRRQRRARRSRSAWQSSLPGWPGSNR